MNSTPGLPRVINSALLAALRGVNTCLPARVESYSASTHEISAQPLISEPTIGEDGERIVERRPVINGVPVVFPGSGGVRVKFPIAVGDIVLLIISQVSLDRWLSQGGEVDPLDNRRHNINDAIAIPGLLPFSPAPSDASPMIEFVGSEIRAGGSAQLATKADVEALRATFNSHTHPVPGVTTGGGSTTSSVTSTPAAAPAGTTVLKGS